MMAVSLPPGFRNSSEISLETASGGMSSYRFEEFLQSVSKESVEQIRKTMLRHEELFKEQVKMLHYLYNIQKSAMQEISKAISSQAQVLAFDSETFSDRNCHLHTFIADGKPLRRSHVAQNHVESLVLSQHPYCPVNGFTSLSPKKSTGTIDLDAQALPRVPSKPRREIDLERPPEDYMDDNEAQDVASCSQAVDSKSCSEKETKKQSSDLHVEKDLSNAKMSCACLNGTDKIVLMSAYPEPSQGICQTRGPSSETKIFEALACKSKTVNKNPHEATKNHTEENTCNNLLSVASTPVSDKLNPSHLCSSQDKLTSKGQRSHPTKISPETEELKVNRELVKRNDSSTVRACESLESNCFTAKSPSEVEYQQKISGNRESHCSDVVPCHQSLSGRGRYDSLKLSDSCIKESVSCQTNYTSRSQNSLLRTKTFKKSGDSEKEDQNYSNNGSNGTAFLEDKIHEDDGECNLASKSDSFGADHGESARMSLFEGGDQYKREEAGQLLDVGANSSLPSSDQGSKGDDSQTIEKTTDELNEEEASESIAAKILLSFVPDRSNSTSEEQERGYVKDMEVEPRRKNTNAISHERKRSLRTRRTVNYYDGGIMEETIKWTRSFQGRRSLRRP
ncbi:hypothetical protein Syun_010933 [Stephania yunnanensis]|uniref:Uncharacterized protein n=1 Tax=Stephania yunnanensis TaxID=152371 RepID=A0AAP0PE02_9MAGN